jgi:hypothetical protein
MPLMSDTRMTDEWIERAVRDNPIVLLDNGNYRTCPVRLSFPNLFEMSKPKRADIKPSYGANLLFPPCAILKPLQDAIVETLKEECPDALRAKDDKKYQKVKLPILDQADMLKYDGYTEGGKYIIATSKKNRPPVVDLRQQIITDEERVYPGVWAICTVRPFWYDAQVNKGVSFGLQSVMIVADDENLGGGGEDISTAFGGVKIDAGDVNTAELFS